MSSTNVLSGNTHVSGTLSANAMALPAASVGDAQLAAGANFDATKFVHQTVETYDQADGTAVVAETRAVRIARAAGTLVAVEAILSGAIATGADRTVTIDIKKSTGAGAFATVLAATFGFTNGSVLRTIVAGSISSAAYVDNDIFEVVVTVAGAAGSQAQGLCINLTFRENPQ